jgi:hypothetical protein
MCLFAVRPLPVGFAMPKTRRNCISGTEPPDFDFTENHPQNEAIFIMYYVLRKREVYRVDIILDYLYNVIREPLCFRRRNTWK